MYMYYVRKAKPEENKTQKKNQKKKRKKLNINYLRISYTILPQLNYTYL